MALTKPDGGVRPFAVECTLRMLVAKCVVVSVRELLGEVLAPLQLGLVLPWALKQLFMLLASAYPTWTPLLLKLDFLQRI